MFLFVEKRQNYFFKEKINFSTVYQFVVYVCFLIILISSLAFIRFLGVPILWAIQFLTACSYRHALAGGAKQLKANV